MNELNQGILVVAIGFTIVLGCFIGTAIMEVFHSFAKEWFARKLFGAETHGSLLADRPSAWEFCWWLPYGVFALAVNAGLWILYFLIHGGAK